MAYLFLAVAALFGSLAAWAKFGQSGRLTGAPVANASGASLAKFFRHFQRR